MDFMEIFARIFALAFGLVVGGGALAIVIWRDSWRWRQLAEVYATDLASLSAPERRFATLILEGRGVAFNSYRGMVTLQADRGGLHIRFRPLFLSVPFYRNLYIPFGELTASFRRWALVVRACEMETAQVPGLKILLREEAAEWLGLQSGGHFVFPAQDTRGAGCSPTALNPAR